MQKILLQALLLLIFAAAAVGGDNSLSASKVLEKMQQKRAQLETFQSEITYLFQQPVFESRTLRTGSLYYKSGNAGPGSWLRINFDKLQQDEGEMQQYRDEYIFDGVWLTHIDYQLQEIKKYQQSDVNEPVDAFELMSRRFPVVGFSEIEQLEEDFEIRLIDGGKEQGVCLSLTVKSDSDYARDYRKIDFELDRQTFLPKRIVATSVEDDVYTIDFSAQKVNEPLPEGVFEYKLPDNFSLSVTELEKR